MYIRTERPFEKMNDILDRYNGKVAVLKKSIVCRDGVFEKGSVVYLEHDRFETAIRDEKLYAVLKVYDCTERNVMGKEHQPYRIYDSFETVCDSTEILEEILDNAFVADKERTDCYKEYAELRQKAINYSVDYRSVNETFSCLSGLTLLFLVMAGLMHLLMYKEDSLSFYQKYENIFEIAEKIATLFLAFSLLVPFVLKQILKRLTKGFKAEADRLCDEVVKEY